MHAMAGEVFSVISYFIFLGTQRLTKSDDDIDDNGEMTFMSLQSLKVYCVRVSVESTSTEANNTSSVHCIKLPLGNLNSSIF